MSGISFIAEAVSIQAVNSGQSPSVNITLYTGGIMAVKNHGRLVIDLAGMELPDSLPIVSDHNTSIETTLGKGSPAIFNGQLLVQGSLATVNPNSQHILALNKTGLKLQASVGAEPLEFRMINEGQTVRVNGRTITAPRGGFKLVTKSRLLEATICTLGADPETSVSIAARRATKASIMNFEQYVTSLGFDPTKLTADQKAAFQAAFNAAYPNQSGGETVTATIDDQEVSRVNAIHGVCHGPRGNFPQIEAQAVEQGWDVRRTSLEVLRASRPIAPSVANSRGFPNQAQMIEASMLLSQGVPETFMARHYDQRVINASMERENRNISIHGLINAVLMQAGMSTGYRRVDSSVLSDALQASRMIQASAVSSLSLPGALGNIAGKILLSSFEAMPSTWQNFCGVTSSANFKPFASYDIMANGALEEVGPNGTLPHIDMTETEYKNRVKTRGAFIQISEETMVNDDLGVFTAIPRNFARMALLGLEKACYKALMDNLATIFTTARGNYFEGADSALSIDSLSVAEQKFLKQVDSNGDPLLVVPRYLGVPTSLSAASSVICRNASLQQPTSIDTPTSTGNPHDGKFTPFVSPWLDNANMVGSSDSHWFLFGSAPESGVINVAFLNGQRRPTVEQGEVDFSQLGIAWRVTYRFGVAVGDYRFGCRSKGAA